jgi:hypothetical protein
LRQIIGIHRDGTACPDNYKVFGLFPPSVIWNYNLDGFAERCCRERHKVLSVHGTVPRPFWGEPGLEFVRAAQDYDLCAVPSADLLLERERLDTPLRLPWHLGHCDFVILIGYTFGRNGATLDDIKSFEHLTALLARESRPTVVVDPFLAEFTSNMLADQIKSNRVYEMPIFWNVFASALMALTHRADDLDKIERTYDRFGNSVL